MKPYQLLQKASLSFEQNFRILILIIALSLTSFLSYSQNFYLAENCVTCMCPNAAIGESGNVVIDGVNRTFTKRTKDQITPQNAVSTCTSGITDMSELFRDLAEFNEDISTWDVSNVTNMLAMFLGTLFNYPLENWEISKVTSMEGMFIYSSYNQPLNNWDVSNVTNMAAVFLGADSFNQPLDNWDVSNVTNMGQMFQLASSFNQHIGNWDVSNVTNMGNMFQDAISFNQDISGWCVEKIGSEPTNFALNGGLSSENKPIWGSCPVPPESPVNFITEWTFSTSASEIRFNTLTEGGAVEYVWSASPSGNSGSGSFTQAAAGAVTLSGLNIAAGDVVTLEMAPTNLRRFFNPFGQVNDRERLTDVRQWGTVPWSSMEYMFYSCTNLNVSATDIPDLSNATTILAMFAVFGNLTGPDNINDWDVSTIKNMDGVFLGA